MFCGCYLVAMLKFALCWACNETKTFTEITGEKRKILSDYPAVRFCFYILTKKTYGYIEPRKFWEKYKNSLIHSFLVSGPCPIRWGWTMDSLIGEIF